MKVKCSGCPAERDLKLTAKNQIRTPFRWHKIESGEFYCADCWSKKYILRAIAIPVANPLDADWEEVWQACRVSWALTTNASNWMMRELAKKDASRLGSERLPNMPTVSLYSEATKAFPDLPPQTVIALEHAVQLKYRAKRLDMWKSATSLPTFRYPVPFPVYNQSWHGTLEDGLPIVSVRIGNADRPNGKGRFTMRLRGGHQFRRQIERFREIARGEAQQGEMAIYTKGTTLMVKMVAWFPKHEAVEKKTENLLYVRTLPDALLVAVNAKDETLWKYNGDQVRRWSVEHSRLIQRLAEDSKAEQRPIPTFSKRREAAVIKYRDRMQNTCHEISASLVSYTRNRHFAGIRYDDKDKTFCETFPYFRLKQMLEWKLGEKDLTFDVVSGEDAFGGNASAQPEVVEEGKE